jgi:UDP-N-acetylglucosamine--N-acetylmuramyl-(pentapeptide) pyrophosphoryl-undecaprenol N-acetylglucosamine transferase
MCKKKAIKVMQDIDPSIVFSKGGFVALPAVLAAEKLKVPYILHESDCSLGLSNRLCVNKAKAVLASFDIAIKGVKNGQHIGSPIRKLNGDKTRLDLSNLNPQLPNLLIVGGSKGAKAINTCIILNLDTLLQDYNVIHITGKDGIDNTKRRGYLQIAFAHNMADYIDAADYVISRAGANTLFELIHQSKPTLVIPLPKSTSRGDQLQNAKYFEDKKCILVLQQESLNCNTLLNKLQELKKSKNILINNCGSQHNIDGTQRIVNKILEIDKASHTV